MIHSLTNAIKCQDLLKADIKSQKISNHQLQLRQIAVKGLLVPAASTRSTMVGLSVKLITVIALTSINCCSGRATFKNMKAEVDFAKKYFFQYGYQDSYSEATPIQSEDIKVFQTWAHIPITGEIDSDTIKRMQDPRCDLPDPKLKTKTSGGLRIRSKRYIKQGTDWLRLFNKQQAAGKPSWKLRWTLKNGARTLRYSTCLTVMRRAIHYWHEKTNIDFVEVSKEAYNNFLKSDPLEPNAQDAEIVISFVESGHHNDPYPFDGEGGTLAHAFYPHSNEGLSGDVHFDNAESYTYQSERGRNLLWVATHELGHSLGLDHSQVREAIMYPWYTAYKPGFKLNYDDIRGIQDIYGGRSKPSPPQPGLPKTTTTTTTQRPRIDKGNCPKEMNQITAVYYSEQYIQEFAFTTNNKILFLGYPTIPVLNRFNYFPRNIISGAIDAIFTINARKISSQAEKGENYQVIFTGAEYYVYKGFNRKSTSNSIHDGSGALRLNFPTRVKKIDAVFTWPGNDRTYFFSGTEYWRYDNSRKRFDQNYPKPILGNWPGLPSTIDAAYSSPDKTTTYFISGDKYYLFDDRNIRVKEVYPIQRFLQCGGAAGITDNKSIGHLSIGSIDLKPKESP